MTRSPGVFEVAAPALAASDAVGVAERAFGLRVERADPLESERDQNFRLRAGDAGDLVLKIANPAEDPAVLDLQNRALRHVAERDPELPVPRLVPARTGEDSAVVEGPDGRRHVARLLTFLPGRTLGEATPGPELLRDVGTTVARLGRALRGFFHPAAGHELLWDVKHAARLREHVAEIETEQRRSLADGWLERFEKRVLPLLPGLRAQVIHNDVSRHNTLVDAAGERVSGIIDFGDLVHAPLVSDVAVTVSEVMMNAADPVGAAAEVVGAFERIEALRDEERELLFDLVAARLAVGVVVSAWRVRRHPDNRDYITGDDGALWSLLERLDALEPELRGAFLSPAREAPPPADTVDALLARRARRLGPALSHFYERPLHLIRGRGVWLTDAGGRAYLDAYNNVPHVGHGHPAVVEAIARQSRILNTNTRYLYASVLDYADRLAASLPPGLDVCMFACSGSEANDLAWRLARTHTGHQGAVVVEGAYHGTTDAVSALSVGELPAGEAPAAHVRAVAAPDDYRGAHRRGEARLGERYAEELDAAIASLRADGLAPAAFLVDTVLSSSGILIAPEGYLRAAFEKVRAAGGLCIADEIQAGFGRTGDRWGFEAHGVVPDVVTLGKPIGNGYPLAAVVTRREIVETFAARGEFFSTFGGNPVACAAGLAVLDVIEREGLRENARRVGAQLHAEIEALATTRSLIGDVRGRGLFVGVDLVRDRETREPATREARRVMEGMRERGVLVGVAGPHANVIKIRPPLVFEPSHAERLLEALDASLAAS